MSYTLPRILFSAVCVAVIVAGIIQFLHLKKIAAPTQQPISQVTEPAPQHAVTPTEHRSLAQEPQPQKPETPPTQHETVKVTPEPTQAEAEQPAQTLAEPPPVSKYTVTPIGPDGGDLPEYSMVVKQCLRAGDVIRCSGMITNTTDARVRAEAQDSQAFDDQGNSMQVYTFGGGFSFPSTLLPNLPVKFTAAFSDPHLSVKTVTLDLRVYWRNYSTTRTFRNIPVQ